MQQGVKIKYTQNIPISPELSCYFISLLLCLRKNQNLKCKTTTHYDFSYGFKFSDIPWRLCLALIIIFQTKINICCVRKHIISEDVQRSRNAPDFKVTLQHALMSTESQFSKILLSINLLIALQPIVLSEFCKRYAIAHTLGNRKIY